jgi:AbrB family looped-hinge helix DNA binding protein
MESVTLSSKYQLVVPKGARERLKLRPGMRITVLDKGGSREEGPSLILIDSSGWAGLESA